MEDYFSTLQREVDHCYEIARRARMMGCDPELDIEIPQAPDLAARVEKLLSEWEVDGVAERIRTLTRKHNREEVSLLIAKEYARMPARSREFAIERAIRLGLAVLTEGILVAPLEGIAGVSINKNPDGSDYLTVYFAGPIRSAGGTGQALSVLIADVVRRELGLGRYAPSNQEVLRLREEIPLYKSCQHLQYTPSNEEIEIMAGNVPVCIDGEGTEEAEISGFRDLPRISTNRVRGGACLVIAEGLCLKAPKLHKHVKRLGIDGWEFTDDFINLKRKGQEDGTPEIYPNMKFLKDMLAGRPVLAYPSRVGGFRLRYGRTRATGLAALALNPATMALLDDFVAIGTQIKIERPGKAGAVTPCNSIEGPIALLDTGDLVRVNSVSDAMEIRDRVKEIVDVGEILIPYGEFAENNHLLMPTGFSLEWFREELLERCDELPSDWRSPSFERALEMCSELKVPLHPNFNLFWSDLEPEEIMALQNHLVESAEWNDEAVVLELHESCKKTLERLGVLHRVRDGMIRIDEWAKPLMLGLGLQANGSRLIRKSTSPVPEDASAVEIVSSLSGVEVRARAITRVGARVARPEKARERRMKPPPHCLFPVGSHGGAQRLMNGAAAAGTIRTPLGERSCPMCGTVTFSCKCQCGAHTVFTGKISPQSIPISDMFQSASWLMNGRIFEVKGVQGMISRSKTPEAIEKGVLRAKNGVFVFKDGTIRIDATDVPLTHFKPSEVGITVSVAKTLGYTKTALGKEIESKDDLLELKVQDVIIPDSCIDYIMSVTKYVDELLVRFYGLEPFYNVNVRDDLIGHLVVGLAPHTSGGVLSRIVGFSKAHAGYAHPFFHAAKRRNCDGDEDSIIMLMDCLLNFSRSFLPERRGGLMDAPLVLTTKIDPNEIDKEAHNIDALSEYPLEFFKATQRYAHPKEVEAIMDLVGGRIGTVLQYEGLQFTHDTSDISEGPVSSAYTALETMGDKLEAQIALGVKIRAVDVSDVVHRIITRHLLPDTQGSLRRFTGQQLRCAKCNAKYRRMPLRGTCYCGNKLTLTVHEAGVSKYLETAKRIGNAYNVSQYTLQRISLLENSINSLFQSDRVKIAKLDEFL
ncbi:MAG: DNA polymerase II large subunit [Methanobacteriota archaeon]|nr:MAG: DNA polymerase II large subunit [Euryarchaeota archaeon]